MHIPMLRAYRDRIDALDALIVDTLAERLRVCAEIGRIKRSTGLPLFQPRRADEVRQHVRAMADKAGLNQSFAMELYTLIFDETCRIQRAVAAQRDDA